MKYRVESSFGKGRNIHAASHAAAREAYLVEHENETGWSYPEESVISVEACGHRRRDLREYVCVDGFFERA